MLLREAVIDAVVFIIFARITGLIAVVVPE